MRAFLCICTAALLGAACANERPQRAPDMDPTSTDAAPGEVLVPTALKPAPPVKDQADDVTGNDHAAMSKQGADAGSAGHAASDSKAAGTVAPSYSCPMHPEVRQNTPGKCPKCGMKLVPMKADTDASKDSAHGGDEGH